jgi:hypothetical protein
VARRSTVEADAAKGMFYVYFSSWEMLADVRGGVLRARCVWNPWLWCVHEIVTSLVRKSW